ncbi:hypothetical protein [Kitasatospora sp. NPDC088779]|uniref:hypothetical protein n=1 Tax=Kitasatospora sp. NPDC088779 TaxID=3154964 RepID=UPI0034470930
MGMWIGRPGNLRDIDEAAVSYDRTPDLTVTEFRALSGAVTTWTAPVQPRRLKVSWTRMLRDDWAHLDRIARRIDGPGPVAVVDPLSDNMLSPGQSLGLGSVDQWTPSAGVSLMGGGSQWATVIVNALGSVPSSGLTLRWNHPSWPGYPVAPGQVIAWWVPGAVTIAAELRLTWYDVYGAALSTSRSTVTTRPMVQAAPAGAAFASPSVQFATADVSTAGPALLRVARPEDIVSDPPAVERLTGSQLTGTGAPNQWATTPHLRLANSGADVVVSYAGQGPGGILRFKPPAGLSGWPVVPGERVTFTLSPTLAAIGGASYPYLEWFSPTGQAVTAVATAQAVVPYGVGFVAPAVQWGASTATNVKIGANSLTVAPRHTGTPTVPPGDGTPAYSITGYAQGTVPGQPDTRDVSLDLVEVTSAAG